MPVKSALAGDVKSISSLSSRLSLLCCSLVLLLKSATHKYQVLPTVVIVLLFNVKCGFLIDYFISFDCEEHGSIGEHLFVCNKL